MITVRLILDSNKKLKNDTDKSGGNDEPTTWTESDFNNLRVINLNSKNIRKIDNLELFHDIQELYLKGNQIKVIENIDFLTKLQILDLSENCIESHQLQPDILISISLSENFPSSLRILNLAGNPCTTNSTALQNLQRHFQNLQIITTSTSEETDEGEGEGEDDDEDDDEDEDNEENEEQRGSPPETITKTSEILSAQSLDSEFILREVVDRKCRLQSLVNAVSIETLTKELDDEYEKVVTHTHAALLKREEKYLTSHHHHQNNNQSPRYQNQINDNSPPSSSSVSSSTSTSFSNYELRLNELRSSNQINLTNENNFIMNLRKKAFEDREKLFHPPSQQTNEEKKN